MAYDCFKHITGIIMRTVIRMILGNTVDNHHLLANIRAIIPYRLDEPPSGPFPQ